MREVLRFGLGERWWGRGIPWILYMTNKHLEGWEIVVRQNFGLGWYRWFIGVSFIGFISWCF